ncbi:hypothetical protein PsorP6_016624 [Peronosclerospora sorghi]|uniref:Uncharacterized protein n=1 Tax=Peronosclerospora sorghi TaxID=230839 RepID=A0ACC0VME0_9STRA|nr:hypothetical protein PsorP6_016624 [Peronosclerospora sorghi]
MINQDLVRLFLAHEHAHFLMLFVLEKAHVTHPTLWLVEIQSIEQRMNTTKRKADDDASVPKKSRRSQRGKSEFVSVEVGMREFKKRMGASVTSDAMAPATTRAVEDLTQDIKTRRNRKASTRTTRTKARKKQEKGHGTRAAATSDASKLTLTQVKQQLQREQKERVEQRIQTMRDKTRTTASASSDAAGSDAPVSATEMSSGEQQCVVENVSSHLAHVKTKDVNSKAQNASTALPPTERTHEFIADDAEEDFIYALALEQAENQLSGRQEPAVCNEIATTTKPKLLPPGLNQVPNTSEMSAQSVPPESYGQEQPQGQHGIANQPHLVATLLDAERTKAAPEVLDEMERLRRENALSNQLLPAASNVPAQSKFLVNDQFMNRNSPAATSNDVPLDFQVKASRFLDLGRCDSDQEAKQAISPQNNHEVHDNETNSIEKKYTPPTRQDNTIIFTSSPKMERVIETEHTHEDKMAIATEGIRMTQSTLVRSISSHDRAVSKLEVGEEMEAVHQPSCPVSSNRASEKENVSDDGSNEKRGDDDQKKAKSASEDGVAVRTSTLDCGNYAEYKVQRGSEYDVDDEDMERACESILAAPEQEVDHRIESPSDVEDRQGPDAIENPLPRANSGFLRRNTRPIGSEEEIVKQWQRASGRESSESDSDSDTEEKDTPAPCSNPLEAALRAAETSSSRKRLASSSSAVKSATTIKQRVRKEDSLKVASAPVPAKTSLTKRKSTSSVSTRGKKALNARSSSRWPPLDEFYDFLLDLSPKTIHQSHVNERRHLRPYIGKKLPAQYSSIEEYCGVQVDAIKEEVVASVQNAVDPTRMEGVGPRSHLSLASVSPCGVSKGFVSSTGLPVGAIFVESGLADHWRHKNDHVMLFHAPKQGSKGSVAFSSGDFVLVRSPHWKMHNEWSGFGLVLCDAVLPRARRGSSSGRSQEMEQMCVLVRVPDQGEDDAAQFETLTELCLSNQHAPRWQWSLQYVHNTSTNAREFQAIHAISTYPRALQQMLVQGRLGLGGSTPAPSADAATSIASTLSPLLLQFLRTLYNASQVQAIEACICETKCVLIHGPPGTGKTKTIVGLLSALLDGAGLSMHHKTQGATRIRVGASLRSSAGSMRGSKASIRLLVAAPSNAAVDELVIRVLTEGLFDGETGATFRPRIVRVGRPERRAHLSTLERPNEREAWSETVRSHAREVDQVLLETLGTQYRQSASTTIKEAHAAILENAQIVFCTLSGAGSMGLWDVPPTFDAVVIDEAAQAVEATSLIPFQFRPHRLVFVGDHRQLPATVISKPLEAMGYDRSLFERMVENAAPVALLTQQYRMHPDIAAFPSTAFYAGCLVQDESLRVLTAQAYHSDRAFQPLMFWDVQGVQTQVRGSTSLRNLNEVDVVVQLVRRLLDRFPQESWQNRIGIIAPYRQQIYAVRGALQRLETDGARGLDIEVNTVDGFQGREKEIVIYSCVRTKGRKQRGRKQHSTKDAHGREAFWADERRMNVALTRAKSSLWIVGNSTLLRQSRQTAIALFAILQLF